MVSTLISAGLQRLGKGRSIAWSLAVVVLAASPSVAVGADPGELLPAASPESQGMSSQVLRQLSQHVRQRGDDVRAMIVLRHGSVVFEWYAGDVTRDHNHNLFSVTKSVVATLTGIAIDRGHLAGADVRLSAIFPESESLRADAGKADVTLADLLSMRSGLPCARGNRPGGPERILFDTIHRAPNRLDYILALPMQAAPGKTFRYGNAEPQLVLSILEQATGERALTLAEKTLFRPLGFQNYCWVYADDRGTVPGGYGLRLRAIDMAKLGQLYLNGGMWGGRRVVSKEWIDAATSDQTGTGYGYYWWTRIPAGEHSSYAAKGVWGQRIQVVPDLDLVFVTAANLPPERIAPFFSAAMDRFVLGAVESDDALPERPDQRAALRSELAAARGYVPASRAGLGKPRLPWGPPPAAASGASERPRRDR